MTTELSHLKAGDRVRLGTHRYSPGTIKTVHHVTPTQIVIDCNGNGAYLARYRRDNGRNIGGGYLSPRILRLATSEECAAWDAEQVRLARERAEKEAAEQRAEDERRELEALFGADGVEVRQEPYGSEEERAGLWTIEFHKLTTEQVRALAERLGRSEL